MLIRDLSSTPLERVHEAFIAAFSDYVIPMKPSLADFGETLRRRGFDAALSVAALEGEEIAGLTVTGRGTWRGKAAGYDAGTGVVPAFRRRGLGAAMMRETLQRCRDASLETYVLEVITTNLGAVELYRSLGFEITRDLRCFVVERVDADVDVEVNEATAESLGRFDGWSEARPSWQNSVESIRRSGANRRIFMATMHEEPVGGVVVFDSGDVPLLAVSPSVRRHGVGSALLAAASRAVERPLRFINIDADAHDSIAFLQRHGARELVVQHEMEVAL